ncbi:MAG: cobaltochelatase subunit CobN [Methanolobus sp.]|nr:cobaltochelatase subunit CobN [Methanolobus sp.]
MRERSILVIVLSVLLLASATTIVSADEQKINITYISFAPHASLGEASVNGSVANDITYTFIQGYGLSGPSDELLNASENGFLNTQDVIFCYMLNSAVYEPLEEYFEEAHENGVSLIDLTSAGVPACFDYTSNGKLDDPICYYYNNMGIDSNISNRYGENLLMYLAKEYGNCPEITDNWPVIKITYTGWGTYANTLERASWTNPYSQNMEFRFIPTYNYSDFSAYTDEIVAAGENGTLGEQDAIFCEMMNGDIYNATDQWLLQANENGTTLIDIYSSESDIPEYFDYRYNGAENITLTNSYNNIESEFASSPKNAENFLISLAKEYTNQTETTDTWNYVNSSQTLPTMGLYHPDYKDGYFETTEQYLDWYQQFNYGEHRIYDPNRPTIGMWFHREDIQNGDLEVVDALIKNLESRDCNVIAGFNTFDDIVKYYCNDTGEPFVQCVISLKSFRLNYNNNTKGLAELEALNVPVLRGMVVGESTDPADANRGIPSGEVVYKTIGPNVDGLFEFIVLGTKTYDEENETSEYVPMDYQIDWITNRSINWAELKLKENQDKKVAIIYYNYPSGKDNIGASYLDTISSMRLLLERMEDENFTVSGVPENNNQLLEMIWAQGINAGSWAPGVMDEMVENRTEWGLQLIPIGTYRQWFEQEIPEDLRQDVIEQWGEPWVEELPQNQSLMIWEDETGEKYIVIPAVQFGNVWIMPQPARGFLQNDDTLYHSSIVPPPHQYIAFYLWLNKDWDADAIIHLGTHGTHEWLPGQAYGMNRSSEWAPLLLQGLPNIYPYIVANVGEGLTAEYRGNALIIDHLTPTLERAGTYGALVNMSLLMQEYYGPELSPQTKKAYQISIVDEMVSCGLDVDLNVNASELYFSNETQFDNFVRNVLHEYIEEIQGENIPYGMHILGEVPSMNTTSPEGDELSAMVRQMMGSKFETNVTAAFYPEDEYLLGIPSNDTKVDRLVWEVITNGTDINDSQIMVYGTTNDSVTDILTSGLVYKQRLLDSAIEIERVISALSAGFIPAGPGTDPIMNTNAVPTGRNFYGVNPDLYPSYATWNLGKALAQELLIDYYEEHGEYPRKVSFSRFGVEFIRDHGTLEAEALYLLGVEPTWDKDTGAVNGLRVIPEEELLPNYDSSMPGRPRIDIVYTTAGMRDAFPDKLKMLDEAARMANLAESTNYPNYVNISTQAIYGELYSSFLNSTGNETYAAEMASKLSTMRCFAVRDGTYEIAVSNAVDSSGTWDNESEIAELYIDKMGYAYGTDLWGFDCSELLIGNLRNVDASVHSDSSNLYDTLDNDDFYQYFGGLNIATRYVSGKTPEMYVSDTRNPDEARIVGMQEYLNVNIRSRYLNDKWIEGMMKSGYAGGRMMAEFVDNLWGWEVSNPELVDDSMWENVYNTYINEEMKAFFDENNPGAYQSITGRMLEAVRKGYVDLPDEMVNSLVNEYMKSVADNGATCCHHTCGNPLLDEFVQGNMGAAGVSQNIQNDYMKQMYDATNRPEFQTQQPETSTSAPSRSSSGSSSTGTELKVVGSGSGSSNQTLESDTGAGMDVNLPAEDSMATTPDNYVEGYEMTKENIPETDTGSSFSFTGSDIVATVLVVGALGAVYVGFWRRRKF